MSIEYLPRIFRYLYLGVSNFQATASPRQIKRVASDHDGKKHQIPKQSFGKYTTTVRTCRNIKNTSQNPSKHRFKSQKSLGESLVTKVALLKHRFIRSPSKKKGIYPINTHYIRCMDLYGLIIKDTIPRVPAFFRWRMLLHLVGVLFGDIVHLILVMMTTSGRHRHHRLTHRSPSTNAFSTDMPIKTWICWTAGKSSLECCRILREVTKYMLSLKPLRWEFVWLYLSSFGKMTSFWKSH